MLYHEAQVASLCGMHCINTLLQGPFFSELDLAQVCRVVLNAGLAGLPHLTAWRTQHAHAPACLHHPPRDPTLAGTHTHHATPTKQIGQELDALEREVLGADADAVGPSTNLDESGMFSVQVCACRGSCSGRRLLH
jgi:hypothetical protein